jgi:tRNA (cytidine/uridine-2'-O-)-methyltransferase
LKLNIVLYQPEIPPNTGNIARTCAITNTSLHLIKPLGFAIDDKTVKRAGLDYWKFVDLTVHDDLESFMDFAATKKGDIWLASTKGGTVYSDVQFKDGCFVIFGRESSGLPKEMYEKYKDRLVRIPMKNIPEARSLNLSNSAAVIIYEALRQNGFEDLI